MELCIIIMEYQTFVTDQTETLFQVVANDGGEQLEFSF